MVIHIEINVGDIVKLKKQHPCGSREWDVLRSGADFRLKCRGCGHQIMIARKALEKNIREIRSGERHEELSGSSLGTEKHSGNL